jgi:hypothetical protein
VEGKTPEIQRKQAETLLESIRTMYQVKSEISPDLVGLRDRAILVVLVFTDARVGAVAGLTRRPRRAANDPPLRPTSSQGHPQRF